CSLQLCNLRGPQMTDERSRVFGIAHQPGNIAHENQPPGFQGYRCLRGGDVCVAVIKLAIFAAGQRADYRSAVLRNATFERLRIDRNDFSDITKVELRSV